MAGDQLYTVGINFNHFLCAKGTWSRSTWLFMESPKAIGAFATSAPEEDKDEDEALGTGSLSNY